MKKDKAPDPRRLDVRRFAEEDGQLEGASPLANHPRLLAETEGRGAAQVLRWSARGELREGGGRSQAWIHLSVETALPLVCQRCLTPVDVTVAVERDFRFAPDEATAAAEDDDAEEDVLAESRSFDLLELVEDEVLMEMPVAPRHVICPVLPSFSAGEEEFQAAQEQRDNPFAVLQKLRPKG